MLRLVTTILLMIFSIGICKADTESLWLSSGIRSYHNDREAHYNENNVGYGAELRFNGEQAIVIGHYTNSIRRLSEYVGYSWQPVSFGNLHIGFMNVVATGYTKSGRGVVIAPIPVASYEYRGVGVNMVIIPTVVTAVQFKFKVW